MRSCTGIPGKQLFLWDIPGMARIVGRYERGHLGELSHNYCKDMDFNNYDQCIVRCIASDRVWQK